MLPIVREKPTAEFVKVTEEMESFSAFSKLRLERTNKVGDVLPEFLFEDVDAPIPVLVIPAKSLGKLINLKMSRSEMGSFE
ncbi:hypothetical protein Tco_0326886, partial [Tanacetum coccineum]